MNRKSSPIVIVSQRAMGFDLRETIINWRCREDNAVRDYSLQHKPSALPAHEGSEPLVFWAKSCHCPNSPLKNPPY